MSDQGIAPSSLDWDFPYASRRMPVFAENVVATSQPLATSAGIQMLRLGGNAVDAALAAAIALTVVEAPMNGIGGDAFTILWDGKKLHGLNGSGRAPQAWTPDRFDGLDDMPFYGWDAVTVPGAVDTWVQLSERFGRLDFEALFEPAIHYARNGFLASPRTAVVWAAHQKIADRFQSFADTFFPNGRAPSVGEQVLLPDHADTLEKIARTRGEAFYQGELAERIAAAAIADDGAMTVDDLAAHRSDWVEPISSGYRGRRLHEIPPSGQGIMALIALGILEQFDMSEFPVDSVASTHLQVEVIKKASKIVFEHLGDIETMRVSPEQLLDPDLAKKAASEIDMERASEAGFPLPISHDTVYLTAADASGMMVSFIQSNFKGFGSGIVVPGTGIALQNRGWGFTLEPGHPNEVGPGKRPYHTIIPGFVTEDGKPLMSFGVMGGHVQAQGHLQMMVRMFDYGQNPQAALDAPRWHLQEDFRLATEGTMDAEVRQALVDMGHEPVEDPGVHLWGGAQLIAKLPHGYVGASDQRKDGHAAGF